MCVVVIVVVFVCVSVMGCFSRCRFAYRDRNDGFFYVADCVIFSIVFNRLLLLFVLPDGFSFLS